MNAKQSGLLVDSVITMDNLATVRYEEIDRVIGRVEDATELDSSLRATLGL